MNITRCVVIAFVLVASSALSAIATYPGNGQSDTVFVSTIEGTVYDESRRPVPDLWIELLNELGMGNRRIRTSSSGHYVFTGLSDGRYEVKVYTSGTPFEEQVQSVEVFNILPNANSNFYQDITLHYKKGLGSAAGIPQMNEVVFVQQVPEEAKRLYKVGVKDLATPDAVKKGQDELDAAIKVFPDYYDALNALGCNYVDSKEYMRAVPYLVHAIDVNQRSFSSFYSLAYAAYKVNHFPEAVDAARGATILQPNSLNAQLLYGTVLRMTGNFDKALEALTKAEKLSKDSPLAEVHWQLALLYNHIKKNIEAANELETYLKIAPDAPNRKEVEKLIQKLRGKAETT